MPSSKKKILFLVNGFPSHDNPSRCIFNLRAVKQLLEFVEVDVFVVHAWHPFRRLKGNNQYANCTLQHLYIPGVPFAHPSIPLSNTRFIYSLSTICSLKTVYRQAPKKIDDYWLIHSVSANLPAFIAAQWSKRFGVPHVTQLIGSDVNVMLPMIHNMRWIRGWEKSLCGVIADSQNIGSVFSKYYPNVRPVHVIYRGTDLCTYNPIGPSYEFKNAYRGVRFLYLGGFPQSRGDPTANKKGGYTLISAWRRYEKSFIDMDASLLLGGPETPNARLQFWQDSLIDPSRVHILGSVKPEDVPSIMRAADTILIPSPNEGLPNVGMEALACGKPVFGNDVGGIPELVRDNKVGILVSPNDIDAWGKALIKVASDKTTLVNMGKFARLQAENVFNSENYGQNIFEFYKEIVL